MSRPVTIFTGQWTDLTFEEICEKASKWGYDGLEIACWGDHFDATKALSQEDYIDKIKNTLEKYNLKCWALGAHLAGQCVADVYDKRLDTFAPEEFAGDPKEIREWGINEMKNIARAAKKLGVKVVTGFMGSPIWKYWYSFPPTSQEMVDEGFNIVKELWTPIFDVFDENGIKFALEVHPTEIAFDYYSTEKLLKTFNNRETLGINFDPSHLIWQGVNPAIFLRDFSSKIYHVHMKDAKVLLDGKSGILGSHIAFGDQRRGWNFRSLGHGSVNFEEITRELNAMNYTGPLSVEWEDNGMDRDWGAKESLEFTRKYNFGASTKAFDKDMKK